ncbi:hypothetical protein CU560_26330, partial [Serratia ureilytica]
QLARAFKFEGAEKSALEDWWVRTLDSGGFEQGSILSGPSESTRRGDSTAFGVNVERAGISGDVGFRQSFESLCLALFPRRGLKYWHCRQIPLLL